MSIDGEQDLRQRLDRAFGTIAPRPAPLDGAIRQGRAIRARRRAAAVTGVAVAAAAAVAVPVLLARHAAPTAMTHRPRHHTVTIHRPGSHAPAGLIAWGTIDGRRWGIRVTKPGAPPGGRGNQCVRVFGTLNCGPALTFSGPDPVALDSSGNRGAGASATAYAIGTAAADVTHLELRLTGGTVLTLHPVRVYGVRVIAFEAPSAAVVSVTAYSRHGEPVTSIPLHDPGGGLSFGAWLRPGQRGLPRITRVVASGRTAGIAWSLTVYQGPWGICVFASRPRIITGGCYVSPADLRPLGILGRGYQGGTDPPQLIWGTAPPRAAHVVVVMSDHSRARTRTVAVGSHRFWAVAVASMHLRPVRWLAYDGARRPAGSGRA